MGAEDAGGVGFVDHEEGLVVAAELGKGGKVGLFAGGAEDGIGDHDGGCVRGGLVFQ